MFVLNLLQKNFNFFVDERQKYKNTKICTIWSVLIKRFGITVASQPSDFEFMKFFFLLSHCVNWRVRKQYFFLVCDEVSTIFLQLQQRLLNVLLSAVMACLILIKLFSYDEFNGWRSFWWTTHEIVYFHVRVIETKEELNCFRPSTTVTLILVNWWIDYKIRDRQLVLLLRFGRWDKIFVMKASNLFIVW